MTKLHSHIFNLAGFALAITADIAAILAQAFRKIDAELERLGANAHLAPAES
jgi:hypothetical protein